jgi:predicted DNA-binding transcriptional regulator YafY
VPTAKAERLLDLVIALLNAPRFRTASWIRANVAGYGDAASDEAFSRMFERDKQELRDLGIPIQTVGGSGDGYRILPGELELPPMSFTPAEAAALAMAGRLWDTTLLADAGSAALRKIRDAADPGELEGGATAADPLDPGAPTVSVLQARVRTSEPSFAPLYAAVRARRAVRFDYRKSPGMAVESRSLEPWGLVSYRGAWYVVGRDSDREAQRTFRLSRIVGTVEAVGAAGAVRVPEGIDLQASLGGADDDPGDRSALLRIRPGAAAGLRRGGEVLSTTGSPAGFDEVRIPLESFWDVARRIAATGPDIVVVDPPDLRDAVIGLLTGSAKSSNRAVSR